MRFMSLLLIALGIASATSSNARPAPLAVIRYRPDGTDGKLIALPVSVNGSAPHWFVLDTGAPRSALDPRLANQLRLHLQAVTQESGTGRGAVRAGHPGPVKLTIGGVTLPVSDPLVLDLAKVPINAADRGLIGSELLQSFVVQLDPIAHTVALFNPRTFTLPPGSAVLPLAEDAEHRRFYVDAKLEVRPDLTVIHRLRIDTGSEDSVNDRIVGQARKTQGTRLGNGLGSNYDGVSGVYDAVTFGPFRIAYVWGPGGDIPAIGMEMLRRFVVTFDASRNRLYLRPTPALKEPVPPPT